MDKIEQEAARFRGRHSRWTRAKVAVGRVNVDPTNGFELLDIPDHEAERRGKSRLIKTAVAGVAAVAAVAGLNFLKNDVDTQSQYRARIDNCAKNLAKHDVKIKRGPDGVLLVAPEDLGVVNACEIAGGDIDDASRNLGQANATIAHVASEPAPRQQGDE